MACLLGACLLGLVSGTVEKIPEPFPVTGREHRRCRPSRTAEAVPDETAIPRGVKDGRQAGDPRNPWEAEASPYANGVRCQPTPNRRQTSERGTDVAPVGTMASPHREAATEAITLA